jgi:hypothetical protein
VKPGLAFEVENIRELKVFNNKMLRTIFGPISRNKCEWRK